ncbi:MAG TPA: hypothetical protein VG900_01520 [Hyphomicrobiaceae bacterium]|nr:hypothetical protein [Hyphomicrobiaceae bacterium]
MLKAPLREPGAQHGGNSLRKLPLQVAVRIGPFVLGMPGVANRFMGAARAVPHQFAGWRQFRRKGHVLHRVKLVITSARLDDRYVRAVRDNYPGSIATHFSCPFVSRPAFLIA